MKILQDTKYEIAENGLHEAFMLLTCLVDSLVQ